MLVIASFSILLFNSLFKNKSKQFKFIVSFFVVACLIYSAGFRSGGFDFENYKNGYSWNSFREPIFRLLVTFLHSLSASYRVFFILVSSATVMLTYKYLAKEDSSFYWGALLIFVSNYYIQHDYIQLRIGLACSIFLYQMYYLTIGENRKAFVLWLLACCCHFSMVITVISFFINRRTVSNIEAIVYVVIFLLLFSLAIKDFSVVSIAERIPGISYYYKLYKLAMENGEHTTIKVYNPLYLVRFSIFFLCLLKRNVLRKTNPDIDFYLRIYFSGILIYLLLTEIPVFAFRGSEIFFISELLLFPLTKCLFKNKNIGNCFVILIALIFFTINVFHNHLLNI